MSAAEKSLPKSRAGKAWVRTWRKLYNRLGFGHGYNFVLFVILVGALMGFVLARLQYLDIDGIFLLKTIPGDAIKFVRGIQRIAIIMHLACVLPAGFLVCFQFVPVIRYKAILFHRLNGYVVILLFLVSNVTAFVLTPSAAGGSPSTQTALGLLAGITTLSIICAYVSIKRLRIDLHRAWMIRTWVYAGSVISLRLISAAGMHYIGTHQEDALFDLQSCADIWGQYALFGVDMSGPNNPVPFLYPQCQAPNASIPVPVKANPYGLQPEQMTATMNILFGMSLWLALAIHGIGVELYLWMTVAETERLRRISREKRNRPFESKTYHGQLSGHGTDDANDATGGRGMEASAYPMPYIGAPASAKSPLLRDG